MHRIGVEWPRQAPSFADIDRQIGAGVPDPIAIVALPGGKPSLEIVRDNVGAQNADRMWSQVCIQPVAKAPRHKVLGNVAMRDLPERMDAGVGAARSMHAYLFATDRLDRGLQRALHRGTILLELPAAERRAVIFDRQLVAGHQTSRTGGFNGVPRRNSSAVIGCLPARCNSSTRNAPCAQAIVRRSSSTVPGSPAPLVISQRRILTRWARPSSGISHHAPGNGDSP